ncbi:Coiled-coil domain-containing protein [Helicobacter bizzozeronii]|uniref:Coiled-coil domain-containing protein n=1 Tax=Helicobacter bizzozeronii TaxID=56877 RepID=UPI000CEF2711|nr:Coiled-coil domain-containing protein [Helicobacter bizzozeronii]
MAEPTLQDQEVELETLKREIKQAEDSLESDFAKYAAEHIDADLEALFFDDKPGFIKKLLEMQNQFLQEQLGSKVERAKQLQGEITQKKGLEQLEQDKAQFLQAHPDANMDELINFYNEELPPKYQKQLENLQGVEFFNALYELFKAYKGEAKEPQEQPKEELPQRLEGNTPESPSPSNAELVMNRF